MNWHLAVCGINHETSAIANLGPFQIGREEMAKAHVLCNELPGVMEGCIVSTCNRVEFYLVAAIEHPFALVEKFYCELREMDISAYRENFYIKEDADAVRHLFKVAAGMNSVVLGENQIIRQIKDAYSSACAVRIAGKIVHRLFHQAFRVGKQVHTDTEVGRGHCSISSAAVEMLKNELARFSRPSVLFVGASPMISQAAAKLSKLKCGKFAFVNRTAKKAIALAAKYGACGYSLEHLPALLAKTDVVITCTGSTQPIISKRMFSELSSENSGKKLAMDMAVPPDIEMGIDSSLLDRYDLEDVKKFIERQKDRRKAAIPQAKEIIEEKLGEFMYWYDHVHNDPVYSGLDNSCEIIRRQELDAVLEKLSPEFREEVDSATIRLVNRILQMKIRLASSKGA